MRTTTNDVRTALLGLVALGLACGCALAGPTAKPVAPSTQPVKPVKPKKVLRPIRVAVFDLDILKGVDVQAAAMTDQINAMLATLPKVTIVNRDQIKKVAAEQMMVLAGLVDTASAVKLGKFLSAQYIAVGRVSKIGNTNYVVLKIVDVETTVQTTVAAKASAELGIASLLERLGESLVPQIEKLQAPVTAPGDDALRALRKAAAPLAGKIALVIVSETHVNRPLRDPAAQMAVSNRLRSLGFETVVPKDPKIGWKNALLTTGKFAEARIDYLVEGEGVSAFAASIHGMVSCRARVELRLIPVPGRNIVIAEKGVAANIDLVEALAAKAALESAGVGATDALIKRLIQLKAKQAADKKAGKKN